MSPKRMVPFHAAQSGFTLVEVLVASALIGLAALITSSLFVFITGQQKSLREHGSLQRSARAFLHQIASTERNVPAFPQPQRWGQAGYDPYVDPSIAQEVCYTMEGTSLKQTADPSCFFKIQYFRIVVTDQKYNPVHDIASLPLTRLFFRVQFRAGEQERVYHFSKFEAMYLQQ